MILTSSWDVNVTDIVAYTFENAALPGSYTAKIYDNEYSSKGTRLPYMVNRVKTVGTPSDSLRSSYGIYVALTLNNAYDVILLDTIENITTGSQA